LANDVVTKTQLDTKAN